MDWTKFSKKLHSVFQMSSTNMALLLTVEGVVLAIFTPLLNFDENRWLFSIFVVFFVISILLPMVLSCIQLDNNFYIDKQIELINKAEKSILIIMHSLNPEGKNKKYKAFDEALEGAIKRFKKYEIEDYDVRIIATPFSDDACKSGAQNIKERNIDIKFLEGLQNNNCRFIMIDGKQVVFSQKDAWQSEDLSKDYSEVISSDLCAVLKVFYEKCWKMAVDYETYRKKDNCS